jgi:hypothetical protein
MAVVLEQDELYDPGTTGTTVDEEYTIPSGISLAILVVGSRADIHVTNTPSWNTTENFTLKQNIDNGANAYDCAMAIYGLINPTATTADISYTKSNSSEFAHHLFLLSGTDTTDVATAIQDVTFVNNVGNTSTSVIASGGTSGNYPILVGTFGAGGGDPTSNNQSMTEIHESSVGFQSAYAAHGVMTLPSAVTITWNATNENIGAVLGIKPAAAGGTILPMTARHYLG